MHHGAIPSILTDAESTARNALRHFTRAMLSRSPPALSDQPDMRRPAARLHTRTLHHRAALLKARVGNALALGEALKNLYPDFFRERSLDLPHAIPESDDFPLFFDVHWPSPK
jgi:hypothetical protein